MLKSMALNVKQNLTSMNKIANCILFSLIKICAKSKYSGKYSTITYTEGEDEEEPDYMSLT